MNIRKAAICGTLMLCVAGVAISSSGCGPSHHDEDQNAIVEPIYEPTQDPTCEPTYEPTQDSTCEQTCEPTQNSTCEPTVDNDDSNKVVQIDPVDYDNDDVPYGRYKVVVKNVPPHRPNLPILTYGMLGAHKIKDGYYRYEDRTYTFIIPDDEGNKSIASVKLDNAEFSTGSVGIDIVNLGEDPDTAVEADVPYELDYNDFTVTPASYMIWVRSNTDHAFEGTDLFELANQNASFTMEYIADGQTCTVQGKVSEYKHTRNGDVLKDLVAREGYVLSFDEIEATSPYIIVNRITVGDKNYYGQFMVNFAANKDASLTEFKPDQATHEYPVLLHLYELDLADFK